MDAVVMPPPAAGRARLRAAAPLVTSVRLRRQVAYAAARWLVAAAVFAAMTAYTEAAEVGPECTASRAYTLLALWVIIVTLRIACGGALRCAIWRAWDVRATPDQQPPAVLVYVRTEFLLTLLSVLWTTIGFMYAYSAAAPCAYTPLAQYATALVVLLYSSFILPLVVTTVLRLAVSCGCGCGIRAMQAAVEWGIVAAQQVPASAAQIRRIPEAKYRAGMFDAGNCTCAICMADYADGEALRLLPCDRRHHFHKACIDQWLAIHATCPVCRASMLVDAVAVPTLVGVTAAVGPAPTTPAPPPPPPPAADGGGGGLPPDAAAVTVASSPTHAPPPPPPPRRDDSPLPPPVLPLPAPLPLQLAVPQVAAGGGAAAAVSPRRVGFVTRVDAPPLAVDDDAPAATPPRSTASTSRYGSSRYDTLERTEVSGGGVEALLVSAASDAADTPDAPVPGAAAAAADDTAAAVANN